jgi:hypothetical protein
MINSNIANIKIILIRIFLMKEEIIYKWIQKVRDHFKVKSHGLIASINMKWVKKKVNKWDKKLL